RKAAFSRMCLGLDRLARWLGVELGETTPCFISVKKMETVGWSVKPLSLRERLKLLKDGWPVSLRLTPRIYRKFYTEAQPGEGTQAIIPIGKASSHVEFA